MNRLEGLLDKPKALPALVRSAVLLSMVLLVATPAFAQIPPQGVLDRVVQVYQTASVGWAGVLTTAATRIFWTLTVISMVWTFGIMALRRADLGEFFAELVRFMVFTGFFLWLLQNGPAMGNAIIDGLRTLGANASGQPRALTPSDMVDKGFRVLGVALEYTALHPPGLSISTAFDNLTLVLAAIVILVVMALVAVNVVILLASAWFLLYGGVIFLGFGGGRWTSDMAITYFKTVLGVGVSLLAMTLLIGIGQSFIDSFLAQVNAGNLTISDLAAILVASIVLLLLVQKIPPLLAGIVTGGGLGSLNVGYGASTAIAAAGVAAGAVAAGGAAAVSGAANAAGIASAFRAGAGADGVRAAAASGQASISGGSEGSSGAGAGSGGGSGGGGGGSGGGGGGEGPSPTSAFGNVMRATGGSIMDAAKARIAATPGGRIAARITDKATNAGLAAAAANAPTTPAASSGAEFAGDAIGGGGSTNPEVAAFAAGARG